MADTPPADTSELSVTPASATPSASSAKPASGKSAASGKAAAKTDATAEPAGPGWFRNVGASTVTAMFDDHPSVRMEPGGRHLLPDDPHFPDLERCDAPADAADTARSEP